MKDDSKNQNQDDSKNQNQDDGNNFNEDNQPTAEELRQARLNFFKQDQQADRAKEPAFGQEEVENFLQSDLAKDDDIEEEKEEGDDAEIQSKIKQEMTRYEAESEDKKIRYVIAQRGQNDYWTVFFKQKFDLSKQSVSIRFPGEAGIGVGPFREYLTLCMNLFSFCPLTFSSGDAACLNALPLNVRNDDYYRLGQLSAVSIFYIGRGPSLHPGLVNYIFEEEPGSLTSVDDGALQSYLKEIENGNFDRLYEKKIVPQSSTEENKELFALSYVLFDNESAIQQFKKGIKSITPTLLSKKHFAYLKKFFLPSLKPLSFFDFMALCKFVVTEEAGSNRERIVKGLICDIELYFCEVGNGDKPDVTLEKLLFLFTGTESVPIFGFDKPIEFFFDADKWSISTCGLVVIFPLKDTIKNLEIAVKFGSGYASV